MRSGKRRIFVRASASQRGSIISGTTLPFAEIEAVNLSASAFERTGFHDTVMIGTANGRGRFAFRFPMREGDVVRVRARLPGQTASDWSILRARGIGGAPRPLRIALSRIGLRDLETGFIRIINLSATRAIAAPGAELVFTNTRTGDRVCVVISPKGTILGSPKIAGRAGDVIRVNAATERRSLGSLLTPVPRHARANGTKQPKPYAYHQRIGFVPTLEHVRAPVFHGRPRADDVFQSELPNCHIASACAALAHARPEVVERAIARARDGRYRVRMLRRDPRSKRVVARDVLLSGAFYVRPSGELLYGSALSRRARPLLWWPLIEKAFAQRKGSYRQIGEGGCADVILSQLLGRPSRRFFVEAWKDGEVERVWRELRDAFAARLPVVAGTSSFSPGKYRNTGLVPDHAYSVLACREARGKRWVGVRNPWGEDASAPCVRRKGGYLELPLDEFVRLFCVISTVR